MSEELYKGADGPYISPILGKLILRSMRMSHLPFKQATSLKKVNGENRLDRKAMVRPKASDLMLMSGDSFCDSTLLRSKEKTSNYSTFAPLQEIDDAKSRPTSSLWESDGADASRHCYVFSTRKTSLENGVGRANQDEQRREIYLKSQVDNTNCLDAEEKPNACGPHDVTPIGENTTKQEVMGGRVEVSPSKQLESRDSVRTASVRVPARQIVGKVDLCQELGLVEDGNRIRAASSKHPDDKTRMNKMADSDNNTLFENSSIIEKNGNEQPIEAKATSVERINRILAGTDDITATPVLLPIENRTTVSPRKAKETSVDKVDRSLARTDASITAPVLHPIQTRTIVSPRKAKETSIKRKDGSLAGTDANAATHVLLPIQNRTIVSPRKAKETSVDRVDRRLAGTDASITAPVLHPIQKRTIVSPRKAKETSINRKDGSLAGTDANAATHVLQPVQNKTIVSPRKAKETSVDRVDRGLAGTDANITAPVLHSTQKRTIESSSKAKETSIKRKDGSLAGTDANIATHVLHPIQNRTIVNPSSPKTQQNVVNKYLNVFKLSNVGKLFPKSSKLEDNNIKLKKSETMLYKELTSENAVSLIKEKKESSCKKEDDKDKIEPLSSVNLGYIDFKKDMESETSENNLKLTYCSTTLERSHDMSRDRSDDRSYDRSPDKSSGKCLLLPQIHLEPMQVAECDRQAQTETYKSCNQTENSTREPTKLLLATSSKLPDTNNASKPEVFSTPDTPQALEKRIKTSHCNNHPLLKDRSESHQESEMLTRRDSLPLRDSVKTKDEQDSEATAVKQISQGDWSLDALRPNSSQVGKDIPLDLSRNAKSKEVQRGSSPRRTKVLKKKKKRTKTSEYGDKRSFKSSSEEFSTDDESSTGIKRTSSLEILPTKTELVRYGFEKGIFDDALTQSDQTVEEVKPLQEPLGEPRHKPKRQKLIHMYEYGMDGHRRKKIVIRSRRRTIKRRYRRCIMLQKETNRRIDKDRLLEFGKKWPSERIARMWRVVDEYFLRKNKALDTLQNNKLSDQDHVTRKTNAPSPVWCESFSDQDLPNPWSTNRPVFKPKADRSMGTQTAVESEAHGKHHQVLTTEKVVCESTCSGDDENSEKQPIMLSTRPRARRRDPILRRGNENNEREPCGSKLRDEKARLFSRPEHAGTYNVKLSSSSSSSCNQNEWRTSIFNVPTRATDCILHLWPSMEIDTPEVGMKPLKNAEERIYERAIEDTQQANWNLGEPGSREPYMWASNNAVEKVRQALTNLRGEDEPKEIEVAQNDISENKSRSASNDGTGVALCESEISTMRKALRFRSSNISGETSSKDFFKKMHSRKRSFTMGDSFNVLTGWHRRRKTSIKHQGSPTKRERCKNKRSMRKSLRDMNTSHGLKSTRILEISGANAQNITNSNKTPHLAELQTVNKQKLNYSNPNKKEKREIARRRFSNTDSKPLKRPGARQSCLAKKAQNPPSGQRKSDSDTKLKVKEDLTRLSPALPNSTLKVNVDVSLSSLSSFSEDESTLSNNLPHVLELERRRNAQPVVRFGSNLFRQLICERLKLHSSGQGR